MIRVKFLFPGFIAFSLLSTSVFARSDNGCPEDPYASPSTDMCNPMRYIPNKGINIAAAILYFLVAAILTFHAFRQKANYFLALVIGAWCEGIGMALRIAFRTNPHSSGLYIVCYLFVVLSPCAFLAGDYILLGRLVQYLDAHHYLRPLRAQLVSWIFIISDVTTFLIQAAGGGLSTASDVQTAQTGGHIFLAGIAAQLVSFMFFTIACLIFGIRAWREDKELWQRPGWKPLFFALGFTCICFLIRSVYRTVELSQGYVGYLAIHERYFLGLDCLPLLLGIATYVFFWPGRYLHFAPKPKKSKKSKKSKKGVAEDVEERWPMHDMNGEGLGDMAKLEENYQMR
ncbi:integral membrane protein [Cryptococcus gattii Ru294]|uniref:Integral to membrane protein, putative n=2 Tax=Cryptococcus gattii TaxID=37769 RepID=E6R366_CRYGW|nr:Integral to membrane protein, putative [Cryptococcus gattii WM276]KIR55514.1 integral membrane protein [Cryptococcus gattii Ru294]KIR82102.1 integral membrane protein [Cryptococcus gattii EJB2]KIY31104.1 integral membrane protein [Cryptococcus gattii E566]KJE02048.1 integral membrane protein [Cryptococcus gattii NT-10]ADV20937.1 Integral to membrane protein, putative [Cryptococcus gattii WM276]